MKLERMREICEGATPGPWLGVSRGRGCTSWVETCKRPLPNGQLVLVQHIFFDSDAAYIATFSPERVRLLLELCKAVAPLVDEWRPAPKFDDDVWQKRQDVVLAFDALEALGSEGEGA